MLHFPTVLLFTLSLLVSVSAVFALMVRVYPGRRGLRHWLLGCVLLALGYALRLFDNQTGNGPAFWWAGLCFLGGNAAIWLGILRFCRVPNYLAYRWGALAAIVLVWGPAAALPYADQLALNLGLGGLVCGLAGMVLLRAGQVESRVLRLAVAGVYLVSGVVLMARGVWLGLTSADLVWEIDAMSAAGLPLSTSLIMLRCFALLVLLHADQEQQLRGLATTDVLTSVLNRQGFFEQASRLLGRQAEGDAGCVLMLDLDDFKQVNDRHGHAAGDTVLRQFARLLRRQLRPGDCIGRIGGEEFAALLVGASPQEAQDIANRLRQSWEATSVRVGDQVLRCTVSIGVCAASGGSLAAHLQRADAALYRAKAEGRNRVAVAADEPSPAAAG
jgi:diguanylate cyclase (GGDEF)-like protein